MGTKKRFILWRVFGLKAVDAPKTETKRESKPQLSNVGAAIEASTQRVRRLNTRLDDFLSKNTLA